MRHSLFRTSWRQFISATGLILAFALGAVVLAQPPGSGLGQADGRQAIDQAGAAQYEEVEFLTRGPLHEAFAEPYEADPVAAAVVVAEPPEPIEELPPEFRPEGENVLWIPGYWAWDDEREDFLWVSGLWREVPPDQRWVPGYWVAANEGHRWISGFWAGAQLAEVEYLPMPPASLEQGPSAPPPAENHFYIPGHWVFQNNMFRWRPGFWSPVHENWVWIPAQYIWTPRGTLFRPGYWDYDIAQRGIVFTPVYYRQPVYRSPQFVYRPRYTVDTGVNMLVHMFVRPNVRQYYFGDYYGPQYANTFQPWVVRYQQPAFYDPFFAQYRYRTVGPTANVINWVTTQHQVFARSEQIRPARTIADQRQFVQANLQTGVDPTILRLAAVGEAIENVVEEDDSPFRFRTMAQDEVEQIRETIRPMRELRQARRTVESEEVATELSTEPTVETPGDDPQEQPEQTREARRDRVARGRLQLPEMAPPAAQPRTEGTQPLAGEPRTGDRDVALERETDRAPLGDDTLRPGARDHSRDLPPGRQAMQLTPEEQRDRRTDARAATPPITGQTPAIGETPGLAEERPGTAEERPGIAGPRRGVAGARPGITGARPEDFETPRDVTEPRPDATTPQPGVTSQTPRELAEAPGTARERPAVASETPDAVGQPPAAQQPGAAQLPETAQQPGVAQRPDAVEQQPRRGVAGQQRGQRAGAGQQRGQRPSTVPQPGADQPSTADQQAGVDQQPGAVEQQPRRGAAGQRGQRPGTAAQQPAADPGSAQLPGATGEAGPTAPRAGQPLPGTQQRDPTAGQQMRGDVRQIGRDPRRGGAREPRLRPVRPEGWPVAQPHAEQPWTLPTRPGVGADAALESGIPRGVVPGGRPVVGGAAADLPEGAVPRAGTLSPGGAPGVERGAPDRSGTSRSREAQPFTLPDLSDEEGLRQRR